MQVIVIKQVVGDDVAIIIVAGGRTSPVTLLEGAAPRHAGNPYAVYGDAIEEFIDVDKYKTSIIVAECVSGSIYDSANR